MPPSIRTVLYCTTDSPDIIFDPFALGSIPEPETPKLTHDCAHNRVRKYPSIPTSHPLHTYAYRIVPYRTAPPPANAQSHSVGYMIIRGYPRRKKHTKLSLSGGEKPIPTREPACHCGLDRRSIRRKHSSSVLIFGRLVHVVQPARPLSGERSSHQVEV